MDFPPLFQSADASSLRAQWRLLAATRVRLLGLVGAALFGLFTWKVGVASTDWAGVAAAVCFSIAVFSEAFILKSNPERTWYTTRAAAESVKTLSWRYAVGGEPFGVGVREEQADDLFLRQLESVIEVVRDMDVEPPTGDELIPSSMRAARSTPLEERKRLYEIGRVQDQQDWYRRKATWNSERARRWSGAIVAVEFAGVVFAVLKAAGTIAGDLLGFAGAVVAAMMAWLHIKQHRSLATAYAVTAIELAAVRTRIPRQRTESDWARFVDDAEEAFSREHTLWKASRGIKSI